MAGLLAGVPSQHGVYEGGSYNPSQDKQPEEGGGGRWYFSRKEIEENSTSRRDGIDLKKEAYLRKSYCTFLQDLGMRLKVPQVTIATAIIFCHRFFLRQSHAKSDRRTVATVCMFLMGKVEETPRPLKDVILVSYEIINKKDPAAAQRIKQKEVYEQQKEMILLGERVVLATLGFDLNVHHPYKPLVEAIKKFKVAQNALAQVAWNFVNDGKSGMQAWTSLCLQFKPHHIAAGAIFLAAKFLKVKLPSEGEKVWWQEFDVTPRQLEEVSNQMLELYEQNRVPPSQTSEVEGSAGGGVTPRAPIKVPAATEEHLSNNSNSQDGGATSKPGALKSASSRPVPDQSHLDNHAGPPRATQNQTKDYVNTGMNSKADHKRDSDVNDNQRYDSESLPQQGNTREVQNNSKYGSEGHGEDDHQRNAGRSDIKESRDKYHGRNLDHKDGKLGQSPQDAIVKIDKDKVKAALEKRRKARGVTAPKIDFTDESDLIERELEDGIELAAENEKVRLDRTQNWSKPSNRPDNDYGHHAKHQDEDDGHQRTKWQTSSGQEFDNVEEGEVATFDDADRGFWSPKSSNRKRKAGSPPEKPMEGKQRHDYIPASHHHIHHDFPEDRDGLVRPAYSERDHKRQVQENHV